MPGIYACHKLNNHNHFIWLDKIDFETYFSPKFFIMREIRFSSFAFKGMLERWNGGIMGRGTLEELVDGPPKAEGKKFK